MANKNGTATMYKQPMASGWNGLDGSMHLSNKPVVKIFGVGGGGAKAVCRIYEQRLPEVEYYCVDTDEQQLGRCAVPNRIVLGKAMTSGLGTGGDPELGRLVAQADQELIRKAVTEADLVCLDARLGGGTGSGATPEIASSAKERGAYVVVLATLPFGFEALERQHSAEDAVRRLADIVDTLVVISHADLLRLRLTTSNGFTPDEVVHLADLVLDRTTQVISQNTLVEGKPGADYDRIRAVISCVGPAASVITGHAVKSSAVAGL